MIPKGEEEKRRKHPYIQGVAITLTNGDDYKFPPIPLGVVEADRIIEIIDTIDDVEKNVEKFKLAFEAMYLLWSFNYNGTKEEFGGMVNMGMIDKIFEAAHGMANLTEDIKKKSETE